MGGVSVLGDIVHPLGAYLYLYERVVLVLDSDVKGLVAIGLRSGQPVP